MNILFVCNQGRHRSRTAAELFSKEYNTKYCGVYSNLSKNDIDWANLIVVMEDHQRKEISIKFPKEYLAKQILCASIPDIYSYNQPELILIIKEKSSIYLPLIKA